MSFVWTCHMTYITCHIANIRLILVKIKLKCIFPSKLNEMNATKNCVQDKKFNERVILLFIHGYKPICYLVLYRVLHAPSVLTLRSGLRLMQIHRKTFIWFFMSETKKDKLMTRDLREIKFFAFLSLTFNFDIKF